MSASSSPKIDLRSDTVTQPTVPMREAIFNAVVGEDMVGEDPTVNLLEKNCAELFGKEAAVFFCSGTQSNQAAIWSHCRSGDSLLIEQFGHLANYEGGAPAALTGVSVQLIPGEDGMLRVEHLEGKLKPKEQHFPNTQLLCLENTTNIGGGRAYPLDDLQATTDWGRNNGLKCHLDGARVFNACTAQGYTPQEVAAPFDTVSVCFSKGLGCPMGSILVGDAQTMKRARRARKIFGGALRQTGIVAAAAQYALDHHRERLQDDHRRAKQLAEGLSELPGLNVNLDRVETNLFFIEVDEARISGKELVSRLAELGVLLYAIGPQRLRIVTHLDIDDEMVGRAIEAFKQAL